MKFKRIVLAGDMHCGHRTGLTMPAYQSAIPGEEYHRIQVELWEWYEKQIENLKPIDIFVHNGDAIDGPGTRSGATELIAVDPNKQIEMAHEAIKIADAPTYLLTFGTAYHTGCTTDYERILANELNATIKSHLWLEVNGLVFDIKHKVSNSSIPYGKGTPIGREWLANVMWSLHDDQPKADVLVRSHVHNFAYFGGVDWFGLTLPALQGQDSKYGSRECSQVVHFGFCYFDVYEDGSYSWNRKILFAESQQQPVIKL